MVFYTHSFRVNNLETMLFFMVPLLLLATISFSCASIVSQSLPEISSQTVPSTSTLASQESSSGKEKQNGNEDFTTSEMDGMSARLNFLEQQISLMNEKIDGMQTLVDQKNSELETKIIDRVSHLLLSTVDSKIMEKTKRIKDISEKIKDFRGGSPTSVTSTTPLPALINSTVPVSTFKNPSVNISSVFYKNDCKYSMQRNEVKCEEVPLEKVKQFFQKTDLFADSLILRSVHLTLPIGDDLISADILGNKTTEELAIDGYNNLQREPIALLKVDVNAFQSSKNYAKSLRLRDFDGSQLDFEFLSGFIQLTNLTLVTVYNIHKSLPALPLLPKLTLLELDNVRGLKNNDSIITLPILSTDGLKTFSFSQSEKHSDASISRILDWILLSSSKTLEILKISYIGITEIPSQIPSFTALNHLNLGSNSITTIKTGALSFSVPVIKLGLWQNKINSIESGAFQGDFSNTAVDLDSNSLTIFDESVFRPILEQMVNGTGHIRLFYNRIDCSTENICHLAWIIRDGKMREKVWTRCLNGTRFSGLSENGFNHCPVTKKP